MAGSVILLPLNAVPYQVVQTPLSGHALRITLQQRSTGLYFSLAMDGQDVVCNVLCQDRTWLVRKAYLGVPGDFAFIDTQGVADPDYTVLGTRFALVYQEGRDV